MVGSGSTPHTLQVGKLALIDRGWSVVMCHVRGGGELGMLPLFFYITLKPTVVWFIQSMRLTYELGVVWESFSPPTQNEMQYTPMKPKAPRSTGGGVWSCATSTAAANWVPNLHKP